MIECRNCRTSFSGRFCNHCGQKATVGELTMHELMHEAWHAFTHTDTGMLRLTKDLFLHPRQTYLNYFAGQRKKYFNPLTYFLVLAAILIFIGIKVFDYQDYKFRYFDELGRLAFHETKLIVLLLLPLEVLLTWLLSHRKFNLAKNIVFWLFLNGLLFAVKICFTPIYFLFISDKLYIDRSVDILQYLFILWHTIAIFGERKWWNILYCFIAMNIIFVANYLIALYLIFGQDAYKFAHTNNVFELMLKPYLP